jgi:putative chitinase
MTTQVLTLVDWMRAAGVSPANAGVWERPVEEAMDLYGIDSLKRIAAFLAQTAHESMGYARVREIWGPTEDQARYENRVDLGNMAPGDGYRFRGRGLIQITGRANYAKIALRLHIDCVGVPAMLEEPKYAALSAAIYWSERHLNEFADGDDFKAITKRINGGLNGFEDRFRRWVAVREAMGMQPPVETQT